MEIGLPKATVSSDAGLFPLYIFSVKNCTGEGHMTQNSTALGLLHADNK